MIRRRWTAAGWVGLYCAGTEFTRSTFDSMFDTGEGIYLDHAATTPLRDEVRAAMEPYESVQFGNPNSAHRWGQAARAALEQARERLAAVIGARRSEVVFTGGGTEADNLAVLGTWRRHGGPGCWLAHSAIEHSAVREACGRAAHEGASLEILGVDQHGCTDLAALDEALKLEPVLVTVMWVNNEVGAIQPVPRIAERCREAGIRFHTDAVQAVGRVRIRVDEVDCDFLAMSGHKLGAPKGVGALFIRRGSELDALTFGGGQEEGFRPGTQNVAAAVGMAVAAELAEAEREAEAARLEALRDQLASAIVERVPDCIVNGAGGNRAPHILNVAVPGVEREMVLIGLDMEGVAASAGSACRSGSTQPSHVLSAMGVPDDSASLRFSLGRSTSAEDVREAAQRIVRALGSMKNRPVGSARRPAASPPTE